MKKLFNFIEDKLGYVLIIPALIFIFAFSIIPIAESLKYSFFDFQLNSQQKSGIYFTEHYNVTLATETFEYVDYYLDTELEVVEKSKTVEQIKTFRTEMISKEEEVLNLLETNEGIIQVSDSDLEFIHQMNKWVYDGLEKIYSNDEPFVLEEDIFLVASELDTSIIVPNFIGFDNFKHVFLDLRVRYALLITLIFTVASVSLELVLGLMVALIMNTAIKGRGMVRTLSLIPWAIPTSVAALIWAYLYNGSNGIVALLFEKMHFIGASTDLMLTANGALISIIIADVWKTTPYMALLLLAGLQIIPRNLYEASAIDGAGKIKSFFKITLPLLKPSILVALLFRTLDAFRIFDLIYVLTGGGPGGKTESISIYAYKMMFAQTRFGYGSALALGMAVVVALIAYFYIKVLEVELISD